MGAAASTRDWLSQIYQQELALFQQLIAASVGNWLNLNSVEVSEDELARTARLVTALVNGLTLDYLNAAPTSQLAGEIRGDLESGLRRIFNAHLKSAP